MDSKLKFTDVPEESSFYDLVAGDNVLQIPLFQRPYMWKQSHLNGLFQDLETLAEIDDAAVFMGIIVSYARGSGPGRPPTWMIVDGQQRVSTIYLGIMAAVELAAKAGDLDWAADTMGRYLLVRPMSGLTTNTKLVPSYRDRQQFGQIWKNISAIKNFATHNLVSANAPRPPAASGPESGAMTAQYARIRTRLGRGFREYGLEWLSNTVDDLANRLSLVSIALRDPTVAPKIFERLNYGAEPITVADLVRNEVFARSNDDPDKALSLFQDRWEPFVAKFKDSSADLNRFLFPYALSSNPNIRKADLFSNLRDQWDSYESPSEIIDDLELYQPAYIALANGAQFEAGSKELNDKIDRLYRAGRPSSIYPFMLNVLRAFESQEISELTTLGVFDAVESFLFRRAILGIEPTGLHAVFKGLWQELTEGSSDINEALTPANIRTEIQSRATVAWPSNKEFKAAILTAPLYRRKIASFAIREYEMSLEGETPSDDHQIEHVAPQKPTDEWKAAIAEGYEDLVHTWANLLPLTPTMNPEAGQSAFEKKKEFYKKSMFASARQLSEFQDWNAETLADRAEKIANWALERWPY